MEWPVAIQKADGMHQASKKEIEEIIRHLPADMPGFGSFLGNGARCYEDCNYLEYATGEEDTFIGTVAAEIASERLVRNALDEYAHHIEDVVTARTLKRVHHGRGISCGYHINLCADNNRVRLTEGRLHYLGMWAATASMYTGAGCMYEDEGSVRFAIGQKTLETRQGFSTGTTNQAKPLICLRPEPLADPSRFNRIQIVGLDPNISPWATWMMLGTASLCLRAIEQSRKTKKPLHLFSNGTSSQLHNQPFAMLAREVSASTELDAKVSLASGMTMRAVEIQEELYEMCKTTDHTDEEALVLTNWKKALDSMNGDRSFLKRKVGWMAKQHLLQNFATKHEISMSDHRLLSADKGYDENRTGGTADKLRSSLWKEDMPSEALIADRMKNPCRNTRAVLRADALQKARLGKELLALTWDSYNFISDRKVHLRDPLMTMLPPR